MDTPSYDFRKTAARDTVYNAVYSVIARMLAHAEVGVSKLPGWNGTGTYTHGDHLLSITPGGAVLINGQPSRTSELEWSINIKAGALHGDTGIEVELNGKSPYERGARKVLKFGGFSDSKDMAEEIVREAALMHKAMKAAHGSQGG